MTITTKRKLVGTYRNESTAHSQADATAEYTGRRTRVLYDKSLGKWVVWSLLLNLRWWYNRLKTILRWVTMRAAYWTQFGAMAMPLGVSIFAIAISAGASFSSVWVWVALGFIIAGFASFIAGWGYTIRDEQRNDTKEQEANKERELDKKIRKREHRENLIMLFELASRRQMSTVRLKRLIEQLEQEGREEDGL